jgi:xanthine dehydrogenase accessory factor
MSGWIGGACAEPVVAREALDAIRDGQPRFIRLLGEEGAGPGPLMGRGSAGRTEGALTYPMTCHSGGTLEIYVEPYLPKPRLVLVGRGPVVETLADLGRCADFDVVLLGAGGAVDELSRLTLTPRAFIVVATHGTFDEDALVRALDSPAGYVSLVASRKRAAVIVDGLRRRGVSPERLGSLKAPAGLDIGAVTPEEIAVSILAEVVQVRRSQKTCGAGEASPAAGATVTAGAARDPICGMLVDVATAQYRSNAAGRTVHFCCLRCKETFDREPARYLGGAAR